MLYQFVLYFMAAVVMVFAGNLLGRSLPVLRRYALPGAVFGGLLALGLGPQAVAPQWWPVIEGKWIEDFYEQLRAYPAIFINFVFACLMLGRRFDSLRTVWSHSRRMIVMGHLFAWGQYVVGLLLVVLLLQPLLGINPLSGVLIAIGFQGGHGTAAGLSENFKQLKFAEGESLALSIATLGVLVGVLGGPVLTNLLKRFSGTGQAEGKSEPDESNESDAPETIKPNPLTGRLTVHLGLVAIAIGLAWLILRGIRHLEAWVRPNAEMHVSNFLPLFSVVLLTGMGLQIGLQRLRWDGLFDRKTFERIGSLSLDLVIFSALATLALNVVSEYWITLLVLGLGGVCWNLMVLLVIGPRVYRSPWYAFGVGDFGGGTATTATGIMLINVADPGKRSDALNAYADKQPFYEPLMGGGLVTAMALPIVAMLGPRGALAIFGSVLVVWGVVCWRLMRSSKN